MSLQQFDHTIQKPKTKIIRKKRNFTYTKTIKVLSFGCGVDSVAGLLLMVFIYGWDYFDEIIFADTGSLETGADNQPHWIPAPSYWTWKWNN